MLNVNGLPITQSGVTPGVQTWPVEGLIGPGSVSVVAIANSGVRVKENNDLARSLFMEWFFSPGSSGYYS
jgi:hypothetical protein